MGEERSGGGRESRFKGRIVFSRRTGLIIALACGGAEEAVNVADMAIVTGAILLAIEAVRGGSSLGGKDPTPADDSESGAESAV